MTYRGHGSRAVPEAHLKLVLPAQRSLTVVDEMVVVSLRGALTEHSAPVVRAHLLTLSGDDGPSKIVVDLRRISLIDEAGARPLLEAHRLVQQRHGTFILGELSLAAADFLCDHTVFAHALVPYSGSSFTLRP